MNDPLERVAEVPEGWYRENPIATSILVDSLLAVARAAEDGHGVCSCEALTGGEGPRPLGGGRFYHYQGCDYDEALAAALSDLHSKAEELTGP